MPEEKQMGEKHACYTDLRSPSPPKDRFPRIVIIIVLAEFCERFSFSGMRAFLTLYLRSKLGYTDDGATETYHIFTTFVYVFPIIGGILADNYLGKYRTILYLMFVYAAGNILVAVTAIPQLALPGRLCTLLGLLMITIGTGGIKPCVTAFGGDQFKLPEQEHYLRIYFSILYFIVCSGSLIAKTLSPILRSEVHCFGDKDCYSLAFGAPGLVVLTAIVIFVAAKRHYVLKKPEGNILLDFIKCVALGVKNVLKKNTEKGTHWLDSTRHRYDPRFITDIKKTLKVLVLFSVCPVFWALIDQMGSRWTLQATKMDGRFGFLTVKPDQLQVLNPIFILLMIPTSQKYVYPFLERRNILRNPLHKLTLGGVLAGIAFIASAIVELYLKTKYPQLPQPDFSQIRIFNGNPCSVSLYNADLNITYTMPSLAYFVKKDVPVKGSQNITLELGGSCILPRKESFLLEENNAVSFFISGNNIYRYKEALEKSKSGFPVVRFLVSDRVAARNISFVREWNDEVEVNVHPGVSTPTEVFTDSYSIHIVEHGKPNNRNTSDFSVAAEYGEIENASSTKSAINNSTWTDVANIVAARGLKMESGGVYTILLDVNENGYAVNVVVITEANSITMALLLPQFLIMSVAELLFAITGNEFAFKEAPESMKAVMTAVWLATEAMGNVIIIVVTRLLVNYGQLELAFDEALESMKAVMTAVWLATEAMGNIIIIVVTRLLVNYGQATQFFFYTGLMFVSITVFHFLSRGYQFDHEDPPKKERRRDSEALYLQVKQTEDFLDH